jgi:hypothetical protein
MTVHEFLKPPGKGISIELHHLTYRRLFDEGMEDLEFLCSVCHNDEHSRIRRRACFANGAATWAEGVYGEDWEYRPGMDVVYAEFSQWILEKDRR